MAAHTCKRIGSATQCRLFYPVERVLVAAQWWLKPVTRIYSATWPSRTSQTGEQGTLPRDRQRCVGIQTSIFGLRRNVVNHAAHELLPVVEVFDVLISLVGLGSLGRVDVVVALQSRTTASLVGSSFDSGGLSASEYLHQQFRALLYVPARLDFQVVIPL